MLHINNLSVGYHKPILSELSFAPVAGQLTVLLGTNGSGKSTLMKTLAGLIPPLSGTIMLDSHNLQQLLPQQLAKKISVLPQMRQVPEMTVEQFVTLGRFPHRGYFSPLTLADKQHIAQSIEQCGLGAFTKRYITTLSGGERQRAYVALCLAQDTDIILLDEPTTFLDIRHQYEVLELLRQLCTQGKTLVMVLHDLALALDYSNSILLLHEGHLLSNSSPAELLSSNNLERVFGVQTHTLEKAGKNYYTFSRAIGVSANSEPVIA